MRLSIYAIGHMRGTPEGRLCEDFCDRARKLGRNMGFAAVTLEELPVSKQRDAATRMKDEAERLAARLPEGAHVVLLDARGKGHDQRRLCRNAGLAA
jgi:23S rRNA (pseudouridine1915-N3)-methyltransferase